VHPEAPDYASVRPLSAYPAQRCPVRLQYDLLAPEGTIAAELSASDQERMLAGLAFQDAVFGRLLDLHDDIVMIEPNWNASRATVAAIEAGVGIILGGALPDDLVGRRSGRPDILLRVDGGYLPVEVKSHGMTEEKPGPVRLSTLEEPRRESVVDTLRLKAAREHDNALQLAHYWRMLEQHGYAAPGGPRGAVVDRLERVCWIDLDEPRSTAWWHDGPVTWLERYDHEFAFRRDIALHTQRRIDGEDLPRKVVPVWISECGRCPWREVCLDELVEVDHVSLLSGSTWDKFVEHRRRGVLTRHDVARLDVPTATAVDALSDAMWRKLETADPGEPVASVIDRRPDVVAAVGADTCGEFLARLDERTASYRGARVGKLVPAIDEARVAVSCVPHRRRGAVELGLPTAAVELDVDLEADQESRSYLWGVLPTVAGECGPYVAVDCYDELTDRVEGEVFLRLLDHLDARRAEAVRLGGELRVYHWTAAELTAMRRIVAKAAVPGLPDAGELEAMIAAEWVDLAAVHRNAVITGSANGLKVVASGIGFSWAVSDPGGDFSMLQHAAAVAGDEDAVAWLRSYNRDDVRATYEIRAWLRAHFDALPRIEDWVEPG
jgi:predicted RecB family nuclease